MSYHGQLYASRAPRRNRTLPCRVRHTVSSTRAKRQVLVTDSALHAIQVEQPYALAHRLRVLLLLPSALLLLLLKPQPLRSECAEAAAASRSAH